jgi:hypothetical protein
MLDIRQSNRPRYERVHKKAAEPMPEYDMPDEIKWLAMPDGEVLMEDPSNPVPNHLALVMQQRGRDYIRAITAQPESTPIGLQGTIRDGNINVGGYLMSDMASPPRTLDPAKSWAGHVKVRNAVNRVREEAMARGYDVSPDQYNIPAVRPGQGISLIPRQFSAISALQGAFFDYNSGLQIQFNEVDHVPGDKAAGVGERWELQGSDGQSYTLLDDGSIQNTSGDIVGRFNPYVSKVAATFEYALPPHGLHFRTHMALKAAGLSAMVTYPPGIVSEYPEGLQSQIPGNGMQDMMISADYQMENNGKNIDGVPVTVETDDDPRSIAAIFDALGGRPPQDVDTLPDNVRSVIDSFSRTKSRYESIRSVYYTRNRLIQS